MQLSRWEELSKKHIDGVASFVDEDAAVRQHRLNNIKAYCETKMAEIDAEIAARIAEIEAEGGDA